MTDHQPPPAVEAIGRLEELARAAEELCATIDDTGAISWLTERDLRAYEPEDAAFIAPRKRSADQ